MPFSTGARIPNMSSPLNKGARLLSRFRHRRSRVIAYCVCIPWIFLTMSSMLTWLTFSTIFWTIEHFTSDLSAAAIGGGASARLAARPLATVSSAGRGLLPAHPIAVVQSTRLRSSSLVRSWTSSGHSGETSGRRIYVCALALTINNGRALLPSYHYIVKRTGRRSLFQYTRIRRNNKYVRCTRHTYPYRRVSVVPPWQRWVQNIAGNGVCARVRLNTLAQYIIYIHTYIQGVFKFLTPNILTRTQWVALPHPLETRKKSRKNFSLIHVFFFLIGILSRQYIND